MAYKFVEKAKHTQEEMAFIAYMIVSSYFARTVCRTPQMADRLYLYYREMKDKTQESREQEVIRMADRTLGGCREALAIMNCEVRIEKINGNYYMNFHTGFEEVFVWIDQRGRVSMDLQN